MESDIKKILWIDDMLQWSKSAQFLLQEMATGRGIILKFFSRENGEDIVKELMMFDFDLVIMDYHMAPFNGDKYISDIRDEEHLHDIPIVFYSQDPNVSLETLLVKRAYTTCVYRTELLDKIAELLF